MCFVGLLLLFCGETSGCQSLHVVDTVFVPRVVLLVFLSSFLCGESPTRKKNNFGVSGTGTTNQNRNKGSIKTSVSDVLKCCSR